MSKKKANNALALLLDWQLDHADRLQLMDGQAWDDLRKRIEKYAQDKVKEAGEKAA